MDHQSNKEIVDLFLNEVIQNENLDIIEEIIHPDYRPLNIKGEIVHEDKALSPIKLYSGRKKFTERSKLWLKTIKINILDRILVSEDERVVSFIEAEYQQVGTWFGLQPSGKTAIVNSFALFTFKDGKIFSIYRSLDYYKMWMEFGHEKILIGEEDQMDYLDQINELYSNFS